MKLAGRYEVSGDVLTGGMGVVVPCDDDILERRVAVKVIQPGVEQRRMLDETRALLKLRSKHVVQVYDVLTLEDGATAIVQEFIEGHDLFHAETRPQSVRQYYQHLWQIASGIADIHRAGVIHRDIKPNNMKVDPEGVIKIFDFGLARDEGADASTLGFVGTRGFAAPELFDHNPAFTPAVDVFAFGAIACWLAKQALPPELMEAPPAPVPPDWFHDFPGDVAPDVVGAIRRCLSQRPDERPPMEEIRHLLSRYLLENRHQALLVYLGQPSRLHTGNRTVTASLPGIAALRIDYTGLDFVVHSVSGDVFINNQRAQENQVLPGSCVIALGGAEIRNRRKYVTLDLSSPEVVL